MSGPFTVAIDGPAASGKGTIARAVAAHFGYEHLDTGLLYRAVGARMLEGEDPVDAAEALVQADLERPNLRGAAAAEAASKVAVLEPVRKALLDYQRAFARRAGGAVLDGRDIGTVICPEAEAKLFVTASAEARAGRRYREMAASGIDTTEEAVLADVLSRDARDRDRAHSPMCAADDALMLDTTEMNIDEAVTQAIAHIVSRQRN